MIFRKPYGFLIKHFKLIHLILTGLFIYLTIKVNGMLDYYNNFELGIVSKLDAINYIYDDYLIAVGFSIIICIIAYILLRYKKKPRTLYLVLIGFVLVVAIIINISYRGLQTIYTSVLDKRTIKLYRDLLRILVFFQYISIFPVLVRGLGFDIKKFNFVKDMHELNLDMSDEEEVELTLGNTNSVQRKFNRGIRELKYYFIENKVFIGIIFAILLVFVGSTLYVNEEIINKVYKEGEVFYSNEFQFRVDKTYVTTKGYDGKVIAGEDYSYVIVKMLVASNNGKKEFNTANLILELNYNSYSSGSYYGAKFSDLGIIYKNQAFSGAKTYLFVFKVSNEDISSKDGMELVYAGDKKVKLKAVMLDEVGEEIKYKVGEVLDFSNSIFGSGSFKIDSYELASSFPYNYNYEIGGQNFTGQYDISSIKGGVLNLKISSNYSNNLDDYGFLDTYAVLKYKVGDIEYEINNLENKTPGNYKGGLYLAVDERMMEADNIWLDIVIRNMHYIYRLK